MEIVNCPLQTWKSLVLMLKNSYLAGLCYHIPFQLIAWTLLASINWVVCPLVFGLPQSMQMNYRNLMIIFPWVMNFSDYSKKRVGIFVFYQDLTWKLANPLDEQIVICMSAVPQQYFTTTTLWDLLVSNNTLLVWTAARPAQQECLGDMEHADYISLRLPNCSCFREICSARVDLELR